MKLKDFLGSRMPALMKHYNSCQLEPEVSGCTCGVSIRNGTLQELVEMEIPTLEEKELAKAMWERQPYMRYSEKEILEWSKAICQKFAKPEQRLDESVVRKIVHTALDLDALSKNALIKQCLPQTWIEILKAEEEIVAGVCALSPVSLPSEDEICAVICSKFGEFCGQGIGVIPPNFNYKELAKEIRNLMGKGKE